MKLLSIELNYIIHILNDFDKLNLICQIQSGCLIDFVPMFSVGIDVDIGALNGSLMQARSQEAV